MARFLVLKVGKLFNVLRGKEKLGYTDDDLSPGQQPPSEQAAGQRSEHMYICGSLKKGYVCGSLLLSHLFSETPMPAPCLVSKVRPVEAKEVAKEEELAKLADQNRPNPFSQNLFWCFFHISKK